MGSGGLRGLAACAGLGPDLGVWVASGLPDKGYITMGIELLVVPNVGGGAGKSCLLLTC
jgi:hypothetical protein